MEELDLKQIFYMFWNRKLYIMIIIFIFLILGGIYTLTMVTPKYNASTTLILAKVDSEKDTQESITQTDLTLNQKLVSTYGELIKSKSVLREVIENLKANITEEELAKNVSISLVNNTELIKITISDNNSKNAANIANEIADVFAKKVSEIYNINNIHVVDIAEPSNKPYNINHMKDIILFGFLGIVVSTIYVFIANLLDNTIKTSGDIEKRAKLVVLASIPKFDSALKKRGGSKN